MISVSCIIPVRNEGPYLETLLSQLSSFDGVEEIFVVAGQDDESLLTLLARFPAVRLLRSSPGRAQQMNRGALETNSEVLWFLHADSVVPQNALDLIRSAVARRPDGLGAFRFGLSSKATWARVIEWGARLRSERFHLPYGDQGFFCRAAVFRLLGGFPEEFPMEDLQLVWRARSEQRVYVLPAVLFTSARKWEQKGVYRIAFQHAFLLLKFLCGPKPSWSFATDSRAPTSR